MIESIVLDVLLMLVVFLVMAIGAYRGGMREAFSAAGLLLGVLLTVEWVESWGGWLGRNTNLSDGGARFLVAVMTMVVVVIAVGYGVGSSFNYHPGPGGRIFGAVLGGGSALIAIAYILTWLRVYLFTGEEPSVIENTYVARFLDGDAGLVLILVSSAIVASALLGTVVRERDDDSASEPAAASMSVPHARQQLRERRAEVPEKVEPSVEDGSRRTAPVRVREARQWEDRSGTMPSGQDRLWSNTWPSDSPGVKPESRKRPSSDVRRARERRHGDGDGSSGGKNPDGGYDR